jgi:ATP-dependent helicase/DNAse subunit B
MLTPDSTLYLAPVIDTAHQHIADSVAAARQDAPFAPTLILAPTATAGALLTARLDQGFNLRIGTFGQLAGRLLAQARRRIRRLDDGALLQVVARLLAEMAVAGELTTFEPVHRLPGFQQRVIEWLREMKSQGIPPGDILAEADRTGHPRDRQLGLLYRRYQAFLIDRSAVDTDGQLWLAADALASDPTLAQAEGPLYVVGFDQFTPVQLRLLQLLTARRAAAAIYLLWNEPLAADGLAMTRLRATRSELARVLPLRVEHLPAEQAPHPILLRIQDRLFTGQPPGSPTEWASGQELSPGLTAIEAPDREAEVRIALRRVKMLLLQGVLPRQIALRTPQPERYRLLVQSVAEEYGIPISVRHPLAEHPLTQTLLDVLDVAPDFSWRRTFDLLRSPYIAHAGLDAGQIDLLDRLTRERPVVAGQEQWLQAVRPLAVASRPEDEEDEEGAARLLAAQRSADELALIAAGLQAFFDLVTPPAAATHRAYALWLQEAVFGLADEGDEAAAPETAGGPDVTAGELHALTPTLGMLACVEQGNFSRRDIVVLQRILTVLRRLVQAAEAVADPAAGPEAIAWTDFRTLFIRELQRAQWSPPHEGGQLLLEDPADPDADLDAFLPDMTPFDTLLGARWEAVDHLFILGLSEGEFPSQPSPDLFYSREERTASPLPLMQPLPGDDASLWWQALSSARRDLTLLRPWIDDSGAAWPPSPYWTAALEAAGQSESDVRRVPIAAPLNPDEAATEGEWLAALALHGARPVDAAAHIRWQTACSGHDLIQRRRRWRAPGIYEGILHAHDILADLVARFGPGRIWSASRLNRYNRCPFGFFIDTVLELQALADPDAGMDAAQRGSLLHAALEGLFRRLGAKGLRLADVRLDEALTELDEVCTLLFRTAPHRYGFRPDVLWRQEQVELRRQLVALMQWEWEEGEAGDYRPAHQEFPFGIDGHASALKLPSPAAPELYVRGYIDRIDRREDGKLRVIDYKSGSSLYSHSSDIVKGTALQSALYALAAEQLVADGAGVAGSYYLHVPVRKRSGEFKFDGPVGDDEIVRQAIERALATAAHARAGRFPAAPAKSSGHGCAAWCDLADICRVTRRSQAKARLLDRAT